MNTAAVCVVRFLLSVNSTEKRTNKHTDKLYDLVGSYQVGLILQCGGGWGVVAARMKIAMPHRLTRYNTVLILGLLHLGERIEFSSLFFLHYFLRERKRKLDGGDVTVHI